MSSSVPVSSLVSALLNQPATWAQAAGRNPLAALCAVLGTILLTVDNLAGPTGLVGHGITIVEMTCGIGFFAALAIDWGMGRSKVWSPKARQFWVVIVMGVVFGTMYAIPDFEDARLFTYIFWQTGAVLMALYYALRPPKEALPEQAQLIGWYGGQRVILAAVLSGALATLLGGGITVALFALDEVLGLPIGNDALSQVWIITHALVWPFTFMAAANQAIPEEEHEREPVPERTPRWIGVTVGWALIPLALLYLAILYAYIVQTLLGMGTDWGSMAALNAAYLAFGVGAHMAALPLAVDGNRLARLYRRIFPWSIPLPLAALCWALWVRLWEYGMTEPRAFLTIVVMWLTLLLVVWAVKGARAGPATPVGILGTLLALSGSGPWGAPEISFISQERALRGLLMEHDMITEEGKVTPAADSLPQETQRRIVHLLNYFGDRGANYRIHELFPVEATRPHLRIEAMGLDKVDASAGLDRYLSVRPDATNESLVITGYDVMVPVSIYGGGDSRPVGHGAGAYTLTLTGAALEVTVADESDGDVLLRLDLSDLMDAALEARTAGGDSASVTLPADALVIADEVSQGAAGEGWRARLRVGHLSFRHAADLEASDGTLVVSLDGDLLLARPAP
jgi:hypothetical protein